MNKRLLAFGAFCGLGFGVLGGLFWVLKPDASYTPITIAAEAPPLEPAPPAKPAVIAIEIKQGRRVAGPEVIRVTQNQELRLQLLSDQDAELHLHGYDRRIYLRAGVPLEWSLLAEHSGRFEFELHGKVHGAHEALCVIEVQPR